jgi:acetylornithine deacetylase
MSDCQPVERFVDNDRVRELLINAVDRYSPTFAEEPVIRIFLDALKEAGIPYQLQRVRSERRIGPRANILVTIGPEPVELILVGHLDTVAQWHEGSHRAEISGDRLEGLGAADMKSGCAALMEALFALRESGRTLTKGLCVALVVGEEEYGDGAERLIQWRQAPLTLVAEPTELAPCTSHFGYLEARLESQGLRAHAALPEAGRNAIEAMLRWILAISEHSRVHDENRERIVVNPREIHGGEAGFTVAEKCESYIDIHLPPSIAAPRVESMIEQSRRSVIAEHPDTRLHYTREFWSAGFSCGSADPRLSPFMEAFELADLPWSPSVFRSHSDAALFHASGSLTIVCGPGKLAAAHSRDEWVSLQEVYQASRLYAAIIERVCCGPSR